MHTANPPKSSMDRLAARLELDIRQRGLWAGDRYLTASQAAEMLGVSTATAHRAMQTLARRKMLVRRRNLGSFVGPHFDQKHTSAIRTVYVVMEAPGLDRDSLPWDVFFHGIRSRMSGSNFHFGILPQSDVQSYVRELMRSAFAAGRVAGFVPVSCPREVYRRLAESGAPTVIFGTPYIDQSDIASVDVDNYASGKLLAEHLIGSGHRRMAVLAIGEGRPGDSRFSDGVSEALTAAALPPNALILRNVPLAPVAVAAQLQEFSAMPERPTALIARTAAMARAAAAAFDGLQVPAEQRCEIVCQNHPAAENAQVPFTCVQPQLSFDEIASRIGEMLTQLGNGEILNPQRVVVPVRLCQRNKQKA